MPIITIDGRRFLADEQGNVVRKETPLAAGGSQIENSGFEVDIDGRPTGRIFSLPQDAAGGSGRAPIQDNVVVGANTPGATQQEIEDSRAAATQDVRTSAQLGGRIGHIADVDTSRLDDTSRAFGAHSQFGAQVLPGEMSGAEKAARMREAELARRRATGSGVPKTFAEMFGPDAQEGLAESTGVFTAPPPKRQEFESSESYALRLADFRQKEARKAFDELAGLTLGQIEAQKIQNLFGTSGTGGLKGATFKGFDAENVKTHAEIIKMADDPDRAYNKQYNDALADITRGLSRKRDKQIANQRGVILSGVVNEATRKELEKGIREQAQREYQQSYGDSKRELDRKLSDAKDSFIEKMKDYYAKIADKGIVDPKSFDELKKEEQDNLAETLYQAALVKGESLTRAAALAQAKKMLALKEENPSKAEKFGELNELFTAGGMEPGMELDAAYKSLGNFEDASNWLAKTGISRRNQMEQMTNLLLEIDPTRSSDSARLQAEGKVTRDLMFDVVNGEITDVEVIGEILDKANQTQRSGIVREALANEDLDGEVREYLESLAEIEGGRKLTERQQLTSSEAFVSGEASDVEGFVDLLGASTATERKRIVEAVISSGKSAKEVREKARSMSSIILDPKKPKAAKEGVSSAVLAQVEDFISRNPDVTFQDIANGFVAATGDKIPTGKAGSIILERIEELEQSRKDSDDAFDEAFEEAFSDLG